MPRTAPDIETASTFKELACRFIDISGDQRTVSFRIDSAATAEDIETFVVAMGAATNASLYRVEISEMWEGSASPSNALQAAKSASAFANIVALYTDVANDRTENVFVPAPVGTLVIDDTDNPDPAGYAALDAAFDAIKFGAGALKSLRYTERREVNARVKV